MQRLLLRQTSAASLSPEAVEQLLRASAGASVLSRSGRTLLVDYDPCQLDALREQLDGWIVSEQGPPIPVPDSCLKIES
ncbi:MAG: hypothetical protein WAW12_01495 [Pseudomonas sp.]